MRLSEMRRLGKLDQPINGGHIEVLRALVRGRCPKPYRLSPGKRMLLTTSFPAHSARTAACFISRLRNGRTLPCIAARGLRPWKLGPEDLGVHAKLTHPLSGAGVARRAVPLLMKPVVTQLAKVNCAIQQYLQ